MLRLCLLVPALALLASCSRPDDTADWPPENTATRLARTAMIGLDRADVRMCAGFPTASADVEGGEIWSYDLASQKGNLNVNLPRIGTGPLQGSAGAFGMAQGGSCSTQVRFVNGKVVQVEYAGDNNTVNEKNAVCAPVVDGCVAYSDRME